MKQLTKQIVLIVPLSGGIEGLRIPGLREKFLDCHDGVYFLSNSQVQNIMPVRFCCTSESGNALRFLFCCKSLKERSISFFLYYKFNAIDVRR